MKNLLFVLLMGTLLFSCTQVGPTEAGFKISKSGSYRGIDSLPLLTGFNWYMPGYSEIITVPTTQQHTVWTEGEDEGSQKNQEITVSCMGGAGFKMDIGLNWHIDAGKASKIYLQYNSANLDYIAETYLRNVVRGKMNEVSGTMSVDSLLNNLPLFEKAVDAGLVARLHKEGYIIDLYNVLKKPTPTDPDLAKSINDKIKAKQDAERTKMELQTSEAEAAKTIATARGDSSANVIRAAGEAEVIRLKQREITGTYVEYTKWVNAAPDVPRVPATILGSSANVLFNSK